MGGTEVKRMTDKIESHLLHDVNIRSAENNLYDTMVRVLNRIGKIPSRILRNQIIPKIEKEYGLEPMTLLTYIRKNTGYDYQEFIMDPSTSPRLYNGYGVARGFTQAAHHIRNDEG